MRLTIDAVVGAQNTRDARDLETCSWRVSHLADCANVCGSARFELED
jgi:hypothetical protein